MVDAPQATPRGPVTPRSLRPFAIALGLAPAAKAAKMLRTTSASVSSISRSPVVGLPSGPMRRPMR